MAPFCVSGPCHRAFPQAARFWPSDPGGLPRACRTSTVTGEVAVRISASSRRNPPRRETS